MRIFAAFLAGLLMAAMLCFCGFAAPAQPTVTARSAIVINADTCEVLFEKNSTEQRAMASTTKIMTALLTLEAGDLDKPFTADSMAIRVEGTSMGLKEGDIVTRRALVYGMLLPSGNDAANAAAVNVSGSIPKFAQLMNKRAAEIGMNNTHFVTPSGLDAEGHYTTAYDMALLTAEALKNGIFREICALSSAKAEFGNPPTSRTLRNSNKLLQSYEGCIGVKTGFTDNARRCLVSAAERNGAKIIAVTLNAPDDWNDHKKLLDYGFSRVKAYDIKTDSFSVNVIGGEKDCVTANAAEIPRIGLTGESAKQISVKYFLPDFVYAAVEKGEQLGRAEIYCGDRLIAKIPIIAAEDCTQKTEKQGFWDRIALFFAGLTG